MAGGSQGREGLIPLGDKWNQLLDLYDEMGEDKSFDGLRRPGINLVRGDGPGTAESARVMVVGTAPTAVANGTGKPFAGQQGRILYGLLAIAGLHRSDVFVTNVVKYHPPGNSRPSLYDQINGQDYLAREREILKPRLTIAVGHVAHLAVGAYTVSLSATRRGELMYSKVPGLQEAFVTSQFHPAYGLRHPSMQPRLEEEWTRLWESCKDVGGILCGLCEGLSAREDVDCDNCKPGLYPEPG